MPKSRPKEKRPASSTGETLARLHGLRTPFDSPTHSSLIERCERLLVTPLRDFGAADLRVMLGQRFYPETLVPLALPLLEEDPLLDVEYYPGDLLGSMLGQTAEFWQTFPELLARSQAVVDRALSMAEQTGLERLLREEIEDFKARTAPPSHGRAGMLST